MTSQPYLATWFSKNKNLILANLILLVLPVYFVMGFLLSKPVVKPQVIQPSLIIKNHQLFPVYLSSQGHGFVDETGKIVIPPVFDDTEVFSEGLGAVKFHGKWGFIDETGTMVIQPRFDAAGEFHNGLAEVVFDETRVFGLKLPRRRAAFINRQGEEVIDCAQFESHSEFQEGLAAIQIGNRWGFINTQGQVTIQPEFEATFNFSEGLSLVFKNEKYGFITPAGDWRISPQFESASDFHDGRARVAQAARDEEEKVGFCDRQGKIVVPFEFEDAKDFSEGLAAVQKNGRWGFIDTAGTVIVPFQFQSVGSFSNGRAVVFLGNGTTQDANYGYIDPTGKVVIPAMFGIAERFHGNLASVKIAFEPEELGYVNRDGKIVWRTILR
jgi:hypothetical protein